MRVVDETLCWRVCERICSGSGGVNVVCTDWIEPRKTVTEGKREREGNTGIGRGVSQVRMMRISSVRRFI